MSTTEAANRLDTTAAMGKRAVLYLRVSSQSQVDTDYDPEGNSIPTQREAGTRRAQELGAVVIDEYIEPGRSATNVDNRPRFQAMMARIKKDRDIDYVIVFNRARTHRNVADAQLTKRDLRKSGATLVSVMDHTEDTYIGDLVATIIDGVNEYQSRAQGADIALKMAGKASRGGTPGRARLGYLNVRETIDGREVRTVAHDPHRAGYIVMLFELYATGKHSFPDLRSAVTKAGLRTRPSKRSPAGTLVSINQIGNILRDRYYLGFVSHKGQEYKGRHQPLIGQELFDRVQQVLYAQRGAGTRNRVHDHYLKGRLHCHRCGRQLMLDRGKNPRGDIYFYFLCSGRRDHGCTLPRIPVGIIERVIEDHMTSIQIPEGTATELESALGKAAADTATIASSMTRRLNDERARLAVQQDQCIELLGDPDWPRDKLTAKMRQLNTDLTAIDAQLAEAPVHNLDKSLAAIHGTLRLLKDPKALYKRFDENHRRLFTKACFKRLHIDIVESSAQPVVARDQLNPPLTPLLPAQRLHHAQNSSAGAKPNMARISADQCSDKGIIVELTNAYQNMLPQVTALANLFTVPPAPSAVAPGPQGAEVSSVPRREGKPWPLKYRLGPAAMSQIAAEFQAGARQKDLAVKYSIGLMSVKRILKAAGVKRRT